MNKVEKKKYFEENGIIKLKLFNPNILSNYRKKVLNLFRKGFNISDNINEIHLEKLESIDKELWSGIFKNLLYLEDIFLIIKKCYSIANNSIFNLKYPVLCNTPNIKINFPFHESHNIDVHQDIHSHMGSLNSITIWIPLQETKENLGPIEYIPSSHKKIMPAKSGLLINKYNNKDFNSFELKLGECLIFSQLLIHRSKNNISNKARISLQIRFNDIMSEEWLSRKYYSLEKKYREKPPENIRSFFLIH